MYFICVSCISTRVSGVWYSTTTLHPSEILFVSCISTFNKGVYSLVSLYLCHSTTFFLYINIQINILAGVLSSTFWCLVSGVWCLVSGVLYINIQIIFLVWYLVINIPACGVWCLLYQHSNQHSDLVSCHQHSGVWCLVYQHSNQHSGLVSCQTNLVLSSSGVWEIIWHRPLRRTRPVSRPGNIK